MKKLLLILAACLVVLGVAGKAKAEFAAGDLIRVVYQTSASGGTYEAANDLGSVSSIMNGGALASNTFNLWSSGYFTGGNVSSLEVAYFATNAAGTELWTSGPEGVEESSDGCYWKYAVDRMLNLYQTYAGEATAPTDVVWYKKANPHSYYYTLDRDWNVMEIFPGTGTFGSFYATANGEAKLVSDGSVSQDIFAWKYPMFSQSVSGSEMLITTVDASGNITTAAGPGAGIGIPIPPSVLLLGSGLLGLAAIRKKEIFNF
ncbi:MAG: hypothetical protein WAN11_12920 [Syntrophobacteraceae bacterium]